MAFEVYERNFQESELIIVGVDERGGFIAKFLYELIGQISPLTLTLVTTRLDRKVRQGKSGPIQVEFDQPVAGLKDKNVLVVDDVLYGGNTMMNVIAPLLSAEPTKIEIAVLIDRGHRMMPISPNFVGIELATTLQQFVSVEFNETGDAIEAFLV